MRIQPDPKRPDIKQTDPIMGAKTTAIQQVPRQDLIARLWHILTLTPISTSIWLAMITLALTLAIALGLGWGWAVPFAFAAMAIHEFLAFKLFHSGLFPSSERVARVYQWFTMFLGDTPDLQRRGDLTEGLFDGDFNKTIEQATTDKYARIVELLGLRPGQRVLDVGCGLGDFLSYLKSTGIDATGLTLSPDQQRIGVQRGLDVRVVDFRLPLPDDLVAGFDAVTLIGSLEHFCTSYQMGDRRSADAVFAQVFRTAALTLKLGSPVGRVFSTTLHNLPNFTWTPKDWLHAYSFHGHYSGLYPLKGDFEKLCHPWFEPIFCYDATVDYQYSSLAATDHFGSFKIDWSAAKLAKAALLLLVNPFAPCSWLYHYNQSWMWQFGGKDIHTAKPRPVCALWYVHQRCTGDI